MEVCRFGAVPYLVDSSCFLVSVIENRVSAAVVKDLEGRGHVMRSWGGWNYRTGSPTVTFAIRRRASPVAAADVRREAVALGH